MLLHAFVPWSRANGPGLRSVVYFQGCSLNCAGCWNPATHKFQGNEISATSVTRQFEGAMGSAALEGVTLSGGEPMQQAMAVAEIIKGIRESVPGASFGMFTGYTEAELDAGGYVTRRNTTEEHRRDLWQCIRRQLDFAIMGRYERTQASGQPLRTSSNQRLHLFSSRYSEADFDLQLVEVDIGSDGRSVVTGFPILGTPA